MSHEEVGALIMIRVTIRLLAYEEVSTWLKLSPTPALDLMHAYPCRQRVTFPSGMPACAPKPSPPTSSKPAPPEVLTFLQYFAPVAASHSEEPCPYA